MRNQHDDHRISTREMTAATACTAALPPGRIVLGRLTAPGAKSMAGMPGKQPARQRGQLGVARAKIPHPRPQFAKQMILRQAGVMLLAGVQKRPEARQFLIGWVPVG